MKYDVWKVNGYDETEQYRIGEHLEKEEVLKLITDPDNFDCMYVPKVCPENTMDNVTRYFTKRMKYDVVMCEGDDDDEYETAVGTCRNRKQALAAMKRAYERNKADLWRVSFNIRMRIP